MKYVLLLLVIFSFRSQAQDIPVYKAEDLLQRIGSGDSLYVINFWATWCGPCVKELPEFNKLQEAVAGLPVKIILVSLDFRESYPKKLASFIKKKKLKHEVVWLNETNANEFIPKLEPQWQGSIPATLILYNKNEYRNFFEGTITAQQLQLLIKKQLAY